MNKNITFAIDEEVLDRVRVIAAQQKTTVNAMVRAFLTETADIAGRRCANSSTIRRAISARTSCGTARRFMKIDCFLDTNVLIYATMGKQREPRKQKIADHLVSTADLSLSAQVLSEFAYRAANPKQGGIPLSRVEIDQWLAQFSLFPIQPIDADIVKRGVFFAHRYVIKHWDAMLVAAAERLGAPLLYTEDLSHEQFYGSVQVINPFRQN
jgi:predicted nucleic acid-binding protein